MMRSILQWLAAAALPLLYCSNKMHVFTFFLCRNHKRVLNAADNGVSGGIPISCVVNCSQDGRTEGHALDGWLLDIAIK